MTEYLTDEKNNKVINSIVPLLEQQFPEFIREDAPTFINFMKEYYKWMEASELKITDVIQNEYRFTLEDDDTNLELEDGSNLTLESTRETTNTSILSSFEKNEKIVGQTSGAVGIVDRDMTTSNTVIYVSGLERTKFLSDEVILGDNNRTKATVTSFSKNPLFASKSLLAERDIDLIDNNIVDLFQKEFATTSDTNIITEKRDFFKRIFNLYRSKGTEYSYDLFFKSFFNVQDLEVYRPKTDLLKPSFGDYRREKTLRVITSDTNDKFESRIITGQTSSASATVDRVENFQSGALTVTELFLTNIVGTFVVGENIVSSEFEGTTGSGTAQGVITNINITSAGTNYKVGDTVTITGGGGQDAAARVSQIGTGAITGFTIFDGGDGYVNTAVLTVNNFATGGTGVSGDVSNIAHTFTFSINEDIIGNFTTVVFNDANYNLSGQETTLRTTRLVDAFGFSALQIGSIANVRATGLGSGYELSPIISIVQDNIVKFNDPAVGIINLNDDPDSISETNAISGTFTTGERITSNSGNKVGTFLGLVSNTSTLSDPSRFRARPVLYTGTFGVGRNDLTINTSNYINSTIPTVYDIQFNTPTETAGLEDTNTFVFRRGINAASVTESTNTDTTIQYTSTSTSITGAFQTLQFPITSVTRSSTTATVTTPVKHGLDDGQKVILTGADQSDYNGEKTITVASDSTFTFTVSGSPATPATGTIKYDENVAVKFTLPKGHKADDRFLFSAIDFTSNEKITGFTSSANATVNTGTAIADGGIRGNNAVIDVAGLAAGSVRDIDLINFGVGYTSAPTLSLALKGGGNALLTANIGAVGEKTGEYLNEDGRPSSIKKLTDSKYYQDYSYSLKSSKQVSEYEETINDLLHPVGTKLFGEFKPISPTLQMGFDHLLATEANDILILEDGDNILMEQYFEPSHSINLDKLQTLSAGGTGRTISITGNSDVITSDEGLTDEMTLEDDSGVMILETNDNFLLETGHTSTDFPENFPEGSKIIIDDEQAFEITYGEFLLEKTLSGTLNCSSSNVLSYFVLGNSSASFTVGEEVFQGDKDSIILDSDNGTNSANIVSHFLTLEDTTPPLYANGDPHDDYVSSSNLLFVYEDNSLSLLESTADPIQANTGDILLESSNSSVSDILFLEVQNTNSNGTVQEYSTDASNNKILILHSTGANSFSLSSNANGVTSGATANITSFDKNLIIGVGTDFEDELSINDVITLQGGTEQMQVLSILNSTAIICNTTIGDGSTLKFDNNLVDHLMLETTMRGTTSANGISDGNTTLIGENSFFDEDLLVGDIICLSTNTAIKAQVTSIINSTAIVTNTVIGDGSSNVSIELKVSRNMDLEPSELTVTLSNKYEGTNNFMGLTDSDGIGFVQLEDGIGLLNVLYTTSNTSSGKLQMEELSSFSNVEPKIIVSS
tara:strand:- start:12243 stop:16502 length:4260 start_codon:yes stop_codon:yes gene_type:complete